MSPRFLLIVSIFLFSLLAYGSPATGISVSCSSGGGGESVSSADTFDLDDSTSLQESISLDRGSISKNRQASGSGNNRIAESVAGADYSLHNDVQSSGSFGLTTSASATSQTGVLSQDVEGSGTVDVSLSSTKGSSEASQEASVWYGSLDSVQTIAAGQGVYAAQSTGMAGMGGSVLSGALGDENVIGAAGSFTGAGVLSVNLASTSSEDTGRASASGTAALDGTALLDDSSFQAVSAKSMGMGMAAVRDIGNGMHGSLDMSLINLEKPEMQSAASQSAGQTAGGSSSSYVLTGYRWNQNNPQIQLYLNPNNAPAGMTAGPSQSAIAAGANTWDAAVSQNLFADGNTVIVDPTKVVYDPFSTSPTSDGFNVHGWADLSQGSQGNPNYLGLTRWWTNGQVKDGYYSITEADTWYASNRAWTTDLSQATGSTIDLQSVAVHELGHTIGLGDLYTLPAGDPRKSDFAQVMNAYDGPQRTLGNGDLAGVQKLYSPLGDKIGVYYPNNGNFYLSYNNDGVINRVIQLGGLGDLSIAGDWEGDGKDEIGVYYPKNGNFYLSQNNDGVISRVIQLGGLGDLSIAGDWDGDGKDEIGVYYPNNGNFYLSNNNDGVISRVIPLGGLGDLPIAGDWNGDGKDEIGVYYPNNGNFYLSYNNDGAINNVIRLGGLGDLPVAGDWDGDGRDDIGVYHPYNGNFYLSNNNDGAIDNVIQLGGLGDLPVAGDWKGSN